MELFDILRERRATLKITQQNLSDITGISLRTIVKIEQGKGNPSFDSLRKLASALGMEITAAIKKIV